MEDKIKIMLTFQQGGQNGGPYHSHQRIMESPLKDKYEFIPLFIPRIRELLKPGVFLELKKSMEESGAEIVQFSGLQLEGYLMLVLIRTVKGVKSVCAVRGSTRDAVFSNRIFRKIIIYLERWTLKHADIVYGVSDYVCGWEDVKKYPVKLYGTIYNFYDFESMRHERVSGAVVSREDFGWKSTDIIVVSSGRITLEKGYGDLTGVIRKLAGRREKIRFLIIGTGSYLDTMKSELKSYTDNGYVRFTGYRDDVGSFLDISDIYISCTWHETFGNSIVEAAYHNLPVVATNTGGIPEIIEDDLSGTLIKKGDIDGFFRAIERLADNSTMRREMGKYAHEKIVRQLNEDILADKLDDMYQCILG